MTPRFPTWFCSGVEVGFGAGLSFVGVLSFEGALSFVGIWRGDWER